MAGPDSRPRERPLCCGPNLHASQDERSDTDRHRKLRRRANKNGQKLRAETLVCAEYVTGFTTFPEQDFSAHAILEWYRLGWQVELVFKRFKQIADLGHLPKHNDDSAKSWLHGKLLVALVTEELVEYAANASPRGYLMDDVPPPQPLA